MANFVEIKNRTVRLLGNIGLAIVTWFLSIIVLAGLLPIDDKSASAWWALVLLVVPFSAAYGAVRLSSRNRARKEEYARKSIEAKHAFVNEQVRRDRQTISDGISKHRHVLSRNYRKAVQKNDYGAVTSDTRKEAIEEFLLSIQFEPEILSSTEAVEFVASVLENSQPQTQEGFDPTKIPSDAYEFEYWVAESLQQFGWEAQATTGSGDQGIDVISKEPGCSVGIQCKLYSQAVGNKAVQEAIAGVRYYGLDVAAVLTNASFTQSAKDLAQAAHVLLISPHDIPRLKELCHELRSTM